MRIIDIGEIRSKGKTLEQLFGKEITSKFSFKNNGIDFEWKLKRPLKMTGEEEIFHKKQWAYWIKTGKWVTKIPKRFLKLKRVKR